jgi:hypothetical protein
MHYLAIRRGGASAVSSKCIREEHLLLINFALILTKNRSVALAIHPDQNAGFPRALRVAASQVGP